MVSKYLAAYNACCVGGWSAVAWTAVQCLMRGADSPSDPWRAFGPTLMVVQTAAVLEIFHSALGLVRSPLFSTTLQVASRVFVLWPYTSRSAVAQKHWSLYLMVLSWCLVEVVRYTFYAVKTLGLSVPKPLLWLRYSLFIVLYPLGITAEILQIWQSLGVFSPIGLRLVLLHLLVYVPFSPYLIKNMWHMRKRAFAAYIRQLHPPQARPANGLSWPIRDKETGKSRTNDTNNAIWAASMRSVDSDKADRITSKKKKWRFAYEKHVLENVIESMKSAKNALDIAAAGLEAARSQFTFVRDGEEISLENAMQKYTGSFRTHIIRGEAKKPEKQTYTVAYRDQSDGTARKPTVGSDDLSGDALVEQVNQWASRGVIEPDCAAAIAAVVENQETWCDLSNIYFVILGASSAMGPIHVLLKHGANVVACDIQSRGPPDGGNGPWRGPWENLIKWTRASSGTLILPVPEDYEGDLHEISDEELSKIAGCNLLTQTPEIANWLVSLHPDERFIIGNYTYLDGGLHVQLSIGCDAIISRLAEERKEKTMACFLCTPTDDHVVPADTAAAVKKNQKESPLWQKLVQALVPKRPLLPNSPIREGNLHCVRAISKVQGPNYALAKRIQHWRAMLLHSSGHAVSSNVAPSTRTISVVHNKLIGIAYNGMPAFKPMEVMYQETSNAVMGALLIHDIRNTKGVAQGGVKLGNPLELFSKNSFHGGVWRCGYTLESIGLWSIVYAMRAKVFAGLAAIGGVVGFTVAGPDLSGLFSQ